MEEYLNKGIKEIISDFPAVATILLEEYSIGCATCGEGTCLFKDIVQIHNLPKEQERELMLKITKVIYPDSDVEVPEIKREAATVVVTEIRYSPPVKRLVDEHVLIKRLIALIPKLTESLDLESESDRQLILDSLDFIRSYADKYHHAKEEDILFDYTDENSDIVKVIYEDHKNARNHVKAVAEAVERRDKAAVVQHLNAYKELLTEHIKKEDEILYPWIDRGLSTKQIGELFSRFNEADSLSGKETPEKYEKFVSELE